MTFQDFKTEEHILTTLGIISIATCSAEEDALLWLFYDIVYNISKSIRIEITLLFTAAVFAFHINFCYSVRIQPELAPQKPCYCYHLPVSTRLFCCTSPK